MGCEFTHYIQQMCNLYTILIQEAQLHIHTVIHMQYSVSVQPVYTMAQLCKLKSLHSFTQALVEETAWTCVHCNVWTSLEKTHTLSVWFAAPYWAMEDEHSRRRLSQKKFLFWAPRHVTKGMRCDHSANVSFQKGGVGGKGQAASGWIHMAGSDSRSNQEMHECQI